MDIMPLTLDDKKTLLAIARSTLQTRIGGGDAAAPATPESEALLAHRGAFVTLQKEHRLRGCIGTFRAREALHLVVRQMAVAAAVHDPRFPPVQAQELSELEIEISALTPLTEIDDIESIQVGTHGLYITREPHAGVLLPQVPVEYGWSREEFLQHTCVKAGLPPDAWQHGATIEVFSAEVFSETSPEGGKVSCLD